MHRGSALLLALWIIAVLSVMVLSFSVEAKLQGGVNIYLREKNRVKRLVEPGRILGEIVLLDYKNAKDWQEDEDEEELFEDDRWYMEKRDLKGGTGSKGGTCTIGPILLDESDPDSGTVTVKIESVNNETTGININELYAESDLTRWQLVYNQLGITDEDGRANFRTQEGKSINLQNYLIAGWMHYRGTSELGPKFDGMEENIKDEDYEDYYEDHDDEIAEENRYKPAHAPIASLTELSRVLCFQEYPAVLTGGVVNPWADKEDQIRLSSGLLGLGIFGVTGSVKVNVNHCTVAQLMTVPGIVDTSAELNDREDSVKLAQAIIETLKIRPDDSDLPEDLGFYPYKDYQEMVSRVEDAFSDVEFSDDASQYLTFTPEEDTIFKMTITCESMGMKHEAECECYVSDNSVRYLSWKEN